MIGKTVWIVLATFSNSEPYIGVHVSEGGAKVEEVHVSASENLLGELTGLQVTKHEVKG